MDASRPDETGPRRDEAPAEIGKVDTETVFVSLKRSSVKLSPPSVNGAISMNKA